MNNPTLTLVDYWYHHKQGQLPGPQAAAGFLLDEMQELQDAFATWRRAPSTPGTVDEAAEHLFKELLDVVWCAAGFCLAQGWDLDKGMLELFASNMTKPSTEPGQKVPKGPDYKLPYLKAAMR